MGCRITIKRSFLKNSLCARLATFFVSKGSVVCSMDIGKSNEPPCGGLGAKAFAGGNVRFRTHCRVYGGLGLSVGCDCLRVDGPVPKTPKRGFCTKTACVPKHFALGIGVRSIFSLCASTRCSGGRSFAALGTGITCHFNAHSGKLGLFIGKRGLATAHCAVGSNFPVPGTVFVNKVSIAFWAFYVPLHLMAVGGGRCIDYGGKFEKW